MKTEIQYQKTPFLVDFTFESNYQINFSNDLVHQLSNDGINLVRNAFVKSFKRSLTVIHSISPYLLFNLRPDVTTIEICERLPGGDDDFDSSYTDENVKVIRTKAYVTYDGHRSGMTQFILYDLLSKMSWGSAYDIPFGLDFGTRRFLSHSINYKLTKDNIRTNWLAEEAVAGFFCMINGYDDFVASFSSSDPSLLSARINMLAGKPIYEKLCVFKHRELLQFIFFIVSEPNDFPTIEEFIEFGKGYGYDFSRLFELLSNAPDFGWVLK